MSDLQQIKEQLNKYTSEEDEQSANEKLENTVLPEVLAGSKRTFNNRKVEVNDEIVKKAGEGTAEIYRNVLDELASRLEIDNQTRSALSRLRNIFDSAEKQGAGGLRNQINKVANKLGLDTQVSF